MRRVGRWKGEREAAYDVIGGAIPRVFRKALFTLWGRGGNAGSLFVGAEGVFELFANDN